MENEDKAVQLKTRIAELEQKLAEALAQLARGEKYIELVERSHALGPEYAQLKDHLCQALAKRLFSPTKLLYPNLNTYANCLVSVYFFTMLLFRYNILTFAWFFTE